MNLLLVKKLLPVERISMTLVRVTALIIIFALAVSLGAGAALVFRIVSTLEMDRSIKPGDDFYRYANGTWLRTIPADRPSYDTRAMLTEKTSQRVRDLIQGAAAGPPMK